MTLKLKVNMPAESGQQLIYEDNLVLKSEQAKDTFCIRVDDDAYLDSSGYHNQQGAVLLPSSSANVATFLTKSIKANCTKTDSWQENSWTRNQLTPNFLSGGTTIFWSNYYSYNEASFENIYEGGSEALYPIYYSGGASRDLKTILNLPANAWWASLGTQGKLSDFNRPTYSYTRATTWFYQAFPGENDRYHRYYLAFVHKNNGNFLTSESWYPYVWEIHYDYSAGGQPSLEPLSGFSDKNVSNKISVCLSSAQPFYMDNYGVWTWDKAGGVPKMKTWYALAGGT